MPKKISPVETETKHAVFHLMEEIPERRKNDNVSHTVAIYSEDDELEDDFGMVELGWYDFEMERWVCYADYEVDMYCWSYLPSATDYVNTLGKFQETRIIPLKSK